MADYKVSLGAEVRTGEIDKQLSQYKGNAKVTADANILKTSIANTVDNFKGIVKLQSKLDTKGISDKIRELNQDKKTIGVKIDPDWNGIEGKIKGKTISTPLNVGVQLKWSGVAKQIANPDFGSGGTPSLHLDVELDDNAIVTAIDKYKKNASAKTLPIKVRPVFDDFNKELRDFDWKGIESLLDEYEARVPLKVRVELSKGSINDAIKEYNKVLAAAENEHNKIFFNVAIKDNAIKNAVDSYKATHGDKFKIPIDFELNSDLDNITEFDSAIKKRLKEYESAPLEINAKLKKAKNFDEALTKKAITINAELENPEYISNKIERAINAFEKANGGGVEVPIVLKPADKGFDTQIKSKKITIEAELEPAKINAVIDNFVPTSKVKVDVKLVPKDINKEVTKLPKPTEPLSVDVELNEASVNNAISALQPTSKLGVGVDLKTDDINQQIEAYHPTSPIKVDVKVDDGIDEATGKKKTQDIINVNVKLDRDKINEQIRNFKTKTKIKVGVKLDFASHDGGQKGIPQQINDYKTKSKIKVGVKLDKDAINQEIQNVGSSTPIQIGVELEPNSLQNVENQINNLRQQLQQLGNVKINIGGNASGNGIGNGSGNGSGGVPPVFRNADIKITDMAKHTKELEAALKKLGFDDARIKEITQDLGELDIVVKRVTTRLDKNGNLSLSIKGIDEYERAVTAMYNIDKNGKNSRLGTTVSQNFKEVENAFARLNAVATQMGKLKIKLAGLDSEKDKNIIDELTFQLQNLQQEYKDLFIITKQNLSVSQLDALNQKLIDTGKSVNTVKSAMADTSAAKEQTQAYKELLSISKEITSLETNIAKLRGQGESINQVAELESQLRTLQSTYQNIVTTLNTPLTNDQWSSLYTEFAKAQDKISQIKAKIVDAKEELAKKIKLKLVDNTFNNDISNVNGKFNKLSKQSNETKIAIERLKNELDNIKTAAASNDVEGLIVANNRYEQVLKDVNNQLKINARTEKDIAVAQKLSDDRGIFQAKISAWLTNNSAAAKKFGDQMNSLKAQAESCDRVTLDHLEDEFKRLDKEAEAAGLKTQTLGDRLKAQFTKYSSYFSVSSLFMYGEQGLRSMFEQVKLIDSAMTELKKVTNETDESYNNFLKNAASKSKELGTTIDGLVASTADFARLGYGFEESQGLAEVANIYAVVGDEIEGVEDATQSLVSTLAAFKSEMGNMSDTDFAMGIVDKMNEVSNNFAISSGGIGEALQRSASSMAAANNTLDETIAMITAANEVAQNPEKVGNAMKTMSMRIRGAKTELEEAGESTDGMAESTASLRQEMLALSGVDIMLND